MPNYNQNNPNNIETNIPDYILSDEWLFRNALSEIEMSIIRDNQPQSELIPRLNGFRNCSPHDKLNIVLCCFYRTQDNPSSNDLLAMIAAINLPDQEQLDLAVCISQKDLLTSLYQKLSQNDLTRMIKARDYRTFHFAVKNGDTDTLGRLLNHPNIDILEMIRSDNYRAVCNAINRGHQLVVDSLMSIPNINLKQMIQANHYGVVHFAVNNKNSELIQRVMSIQEIELPQMIKAVFNDAVKSGSLAIIRQLVENQTIDLPALINSNNQLALYTAAERGDLDIVEYLLDAGKISPSSLYDAFSAAAKAGHLNIMKRFVAYPGINLLEMIKANRYFAMSHAARNKHSHVVDYLLTLAKDLPCMRHMILSTFESAMSGGSVAIISQFIECSGYDLQEMLKANDYRAVREAVAQGYIDIMHSMMDESTIKVRLAMLRSNKDEIFQTLASDGHLQEINLLINDPSIPILDINKSVNYRAFRVATQAGQVDVLRALLAIPGVDTQAMIAAQHSRPFRLAANEGNQEIIDLLMSTPGINVPFMIRGFDPEYEAFRSAAAKGHVGIMRTLLSAPGINPVEMISACDHQAFIDAAKGGHLEAMELMLTTLGVDLNAIIAAKGRDTTVNIEPYQALHQASNALQVRIVERLLLFPQIQAYLKIKPSSRISNVMINHCIDHSQLPTSEHRNGFFPLQGNSDADKAATPASITGAP